MRLLCAFLLVWLPSLVVAQIPTVLPVQVTQAQLAALLLLAGAAGFCLAAICAIAIAKYARALFS